MKTPGFRAVGGSPFAALVGVDQGNLRARYDNPGQQRIFQRPATSIKSWQVIYWINSVTQQNGEYVELKSRCVSGYQGEVVSLTVASGQWN